MLVRYRPNYANWRTSAHLFLTTDSNAIIYCWFLIRIMVSWRMLLGEERPHQLRVNNPVSGCNIAHPSLTHHLPRNPNLVKVCQELLAFNSYEANPSLTKNSRALTQLTKTHPASYINAPYTYYIFFYIHTIIYIIIIYYIIVYYIILYYVILYYVML